VELHSPNTLKTSWRNVCQKWCRHTTQKDEQDHPEVFFGYTVPFICGDVVKLNIHFISVNFMVLLNFTLQEKT